MNLIDLHIHTNCSDGYYTGKEIIDRCKKLGLKYISICDHDTTCAYTEELFTYAKVNNINLIPGVEISTNTGKFGIHILGYNINVNDKEFCEKLAKSRNSRHIYLHDVSKKLKDYGLIVNEAELDEIDAVTKAHIARDVINNLANKKRLTELFDYVPDMGEFIETILNEGCPCYVKKVSYTPEEASRIIRDCGGKVVVAHPVVYSHEDNLSDEEFINILESINPDGIEAYYVYVNKDKKIIEDTKKWVELAKERNLIVTLGSDFHTDHQNPFIDVGLKEIELDEDSQKEIIEKIL